MKPDYIIREEGMDYNKATCKSTKGQSLAIIIVSILVLVGDFVVFTLLLAKQFEFKYLLFPMLLLIVDALFVASTFFTGFRFKYSLGILFWYFLISLAFIIVICVLGAGNKEFIYMTSFGVATILVLHIVLYCIMLGTARAVVMSKMPTKIFYIVCASLIICLYVVFNMVLGFFGQGISVGESKRTIAYSYDEDNDYYIASDSLGSGNTIEVTDSFNGKRVGAIDAKLFAIKDVDKVVLRGRQKEIIGVDNLYQFNSDLTIQVQDGFFDEYRVQLLDLLNDCYGEYDNNYMILNNFEPIDCDDSQTRIVFNYDFAKIGKGVEDLFVSSYCVPKNTKLTSDKLNTLGGLFEDTDSNDAENLIYHYTETNGCFAKNLLDSNGEALLGEVVDADFVKAEVATERVVLVKLLEDNDTKYEIPDSFNSTTAFDSTFTGKYLTETQLIEYFDSLPQRNGFGVEYLFSTSSHGDIMLDNKVGTSTQFNDKVNELFEAISANNDKEIVIELTPEWWVEAPTNLSATTKESSVIYGNNAYVDVTATESVMDTYFSIYKGSKLIANMQTDTEFTLADLKPTDSGTYSVHAITFDNSITSLKSQETISNFEVVINKKELNFNWITPDASVYDGNAKALSCSMDTTGLVSGDEALASLFDFSLKSVTNAGYYTSSVILYDELASNYKVSNSSVNTSFRILPREITIAKGTSPSISKIYDGTKSTSFEFVEGEHFSVNGGIANEISGVNVTKSYDSANVLDASKVTINFRSLVAGTGYIASNYKFEATSLDYEASITPSVITIEKLSSPSITKVYDGTTATNYEFNNNVDYKINGKIGSEITGVNFTKSYDSANVLDASKVILNFRSLVAGTGYIASNYTFEATTLDYEASITPSVITIEKLSSPSITKVYDGTTTTNFEFNNNVDYKINGKIGSEISGVNFTKSYNSANVLDASKVIVSFSDLIGGTGYIASNYTFEATTLDYEASITPSVITIEKLSSPSITKVYDGTTATNFEFVEGEHYSINGIIGSEVSGVNFTKSYNSANVLDASKVILSFSDLIGGTGYIASNYTFEATTLDYEASITPSVITIEKLSSPTITKVYDGTTATNYEFVEGEHYSINGIIGSEVSGVNFTKSYNSANVLDASKVVLNFDSLIGGTGYIASNYIFEVTSLDYEASITPKDIIITADSAEKVYDGTPLTKNTYTLNTQLVVGDSIGVVEITSSITSVQSCPNTIQEVLIMRGSEDVTSNYNIKKVEGILTITEAEISVQVTGFEGLYDGEEHSITISAETVDLVVPTIVYCDTENGVYSETKPSYVEAGEYTIYYKITAENHLEVVGSATIIINENGEVEL